jgi:hypothetical protein
MKRIVDPDDQKNENFENQVALLKMEKPECLYAM